MLRKTLITVIGGAFCLLGLTLVILPGPAWLLLPIGLAILSLEYQWAKGWLKVSQKQMTRSAAWIDAKVRDWRYSR